MSMVLPFLLLDETISSGSRVLAVLELVVGTVVSLTCPPHPKSSTSAYLGTRRRVENGGVLASPMVQLGEL